MRFQTLGVIPNIFEPGRLKTLYDDVMSGTETKLIKRLNVDQLNKIPSIYANLDTDVDITALENDKVYKTGNDEDILGSDLKAITILMYHKPRSAYAVFKPGNQISARTVNGAVPLGLLGFKRFRNIDYDKWRLAILKHVDCEFNEKTREFEFNFTKDALEKMFKLDLLLGKTYASTYYCAVDDEIKLSDEWGLIMLSTLNTLNFEPNADEVRYFREVGIGNYRGSFATTYGAAAIKNIPKKRPEIAIMFNNCSTPMRLLISQRWAWYGNHRTDDMICDFQDWDNLPKSLDTTSTSMTGLKPKTETTGLSGRFGL